jgi:AcrR family transcriptional regulator
LVAEAERMADEIGLAQLTMAGLAGRLGVRQPSLYKHVDGLEGLLRLLSIRAKTQLGETLAQAAMGRARDDAITAVATAYRQWAIARPGGYLAAQRPPAAGDAEDQVATDAVVRVCAAVLSGYGLRGDDAIDAIRALRSTLHGFVMLEVNGGFGLPVDVARSFDRMVRGLRIALAHWSEVDSEPAETP